ncbi:MAG: putative toxin-antitoxin system toxin component, PIN family [Candidatus Nanohaloarchaea archaeon]|nr:putative toxin-antitoxin system toxin component, PIN family [Candidatus Nanohaloarchaea archaeon]
MHLKLVLDTNVVVSGNISSGSPPNIVMEACFSEKGPVAVVSGDILEEYERKLRSITEVRASDRYYTMRMISKYAEYVESPATLRIVKEDSDDDKLFEAAVEAQADCIVSGDSHVLDIGDYSGIEILNPREAADRLELR